MRLRCAKKLSINYLFVAMLFYRQNTNKQTKKKGKRSNVVLCLKNHFRAHILTKVTWKNNTNRTLANESSRIQNHK